MYICAHTHTRIHIHTYVYTYIHTHVRFLAENLILFEVVRVKLLFALLPGTYALWEPCVFVVLKGAVRPPFCVLTFRAELLHNRELAQSHQCRATGTSSCWLTWESTIAVLFWKMALTDQKKAMVDVVLLVSSSIFMSTIMGWMGPKFPSEDYIFCCSPGGGGR